jgi:hypothetical protein
VQAEVVVALEHCEHLPDNKLVEGHSIRKTQTDLDRSKFGLHRLVPILLALWRSWRRIQE